MLVAVHAAQGVLALIAARMVAQKLRQLGTAAERDADRKATAALARALEADDRVALAQLLEELPVRYPTQLLDAALDAIEGEGDVGAFLYAASLDARHQAIAGVRLIRGLATLAGTVGLLAAMVHYFALLHGDHGPSAAALARAETAANQGALVSMALGLATALGLFVSSRVIRGRVLRRLADITDAVERLEQAAEGARASREAPPAVDPPA